MKFGRVRRAYSFLVGARPKLRSNASVLTGSFRPISGNCAGAYRDACLLAVKDCFLGVAFVGLLLVLHLLRTAQGQTAKTIYF
jgi:hypothetical protein